MTLTIRPFPKRTYQNGIRPFRPVVPTNNIRPYTLKTWRPPVPEPLAPAPLIGPRGLLALAGLVLAQLWGLRNAKKGDPSAEEPGALGFWKPLGAGSGELILSWKLEGTNQVFSSRWPASVVKVEHGSTFIPEEAGHPNGSGYTYDLRGYDNTGALRTSGSLAIGGFAGLVIQNCSKPPCAVVEFVRVLYDRLDGSALEPLPYIPYIPGPVQAPLPSPEAEPVPTPSPKPSQVPRPLPFPSPALPGTPGTAAPPVTDPVPQEPGPQRPPTVRPLPLPPVFPRPENAPGAQPLPNGLPVPQTPAPVAVTPPDAHYPVPGAPPVTGNGPRPTPEGIAQELGRLEQKLARLSDPGPEGPGDGSDRLQLISDLINRLIEFATSMTSGGAYSLSSPCELDENGDRIVSSVEYSGDTNAIGVLGNKIDALASVLQVHKDLKQPICKQAPAVGQPVTVNFVQVD